MSTTIALARVRRFLVREDGVTAIEYALIAALIAVAIIAAVTAVGVNITAVYNYISGAVAGAV